MLSVKSRTIIVQYSTYWFPLSEILADDASICAKGHVISYGCQATLPGLELILIDVNIAMWLEVLVVETCLSRSTEWEKFIRIVGRLNGRNGLRVPDE